MTVTLKPKTTEAVPVVSLTVKATLKTIMDDIGNLPDEIMQDCQQQEIEIMGPFIFEYRGADGNPETQFDLEMALPVKEGLNYQGKYKYKTLAPIECVEQRFTGPLSQLEEKGYGPLMNAMQEQGFAIKDTCREVYTKWVEPESPENIIELQMAI